MHDTSASFFKKLTERGFVYERLRDELMEEKYRGLLFGLFAIEKRRKGIELR